MNLEKINELTAQDMAGVNAAILEQLNSDVQLINQLGYYIVSGGGKRIRPMIAVLAARAVGYEGNAHVTIAALIEFIHTATLLHDDVVDESDMRRGKATANAAFGNAASVLVGDFIYTRAFQMMTSLVIFFAKLVGINSSTSKISFRLEMLLLRSTVMDLISFNNS